MNIVHVEASHSYDVRIGSGILDTIGEAVSSVSKAEEVFILSDSNVWPLYGERVRNALMAAGFRVSWYAIQAGEQSKNGNEYLKVLHYLSQHQLTRSDLIVALGGGVVGDLAGFAAATYLRGIPFIQVPTSLLAMVDSSVGGKTAINLPEGKNLCGAFWQPSLVLCDVDTLNTLPEDIFRDGCAEVIKYGILYDPQLFSHLEEKGIHFDRVSVITRCVELKRDVVAQDEFDTGARMKLNLGHTFGHGIEAQSVLSLSHGKSVAIGMAIASRASHCPDQERIIRCLKFFDLPTTVSYSPMSIYHYALADKKRAGSTIRLILPRKIGNCEIVAVPVTDLLDMIKEGL